MGRRKTRKRRILTSIKNEKGYLLISTLFFLVFSGLFSHSVIKISANQIMQLRQFSTAYKAKGALNVGEKILEENLHQNEEVPSHGIISTSLGEINIDRANDEIFRLTIHLENGTVFSKEYEFKEEEDKVEEKLEEKIENQEESSKDENKEDEDEVKELNN